MEEDTKILQMLRSVDINMVNLALSILCTRGKEGVAEFYNRHGDRVVVGTVSNHGVGRQWLSERWISVDRDEQLYWVHHTSLDIYFTVWAHGLIPWEYISGSCWPPPVNIVDI